MFCPNQKGNTLSTNLETYNHTLIFSVKTNAKIALKNKIRQANLKTRNVSKIRKAIYAKSYFSKDGASKR